MRSISNFMANKIKLYNGVMFDPFHPVAEDIDIVNIAHGLSREPRFSGQNPGLPYTVAQHSVLVSHNSPYEALAGLLHDSAEGLGLRDVATPIKKHWTMTPYRRAENRLLKMVFERYELPWPLSQEVHEADQLMFRFEKKALWNEHEEFKGFWCIKGPKNQYMSHPEDLEVWSPARAEHEFLVRFAELTQHHWHSINGMLLADRKWAVRRPRPDTGLLDLKKWGTWEWPDVNYTGVDYEPSR